MIALWKTDCDRTRDHLALWVSDDLVGEERRQVERHLAGCARCRAEASRVRDLLETLAEVGRDDPPGWPQAVANGSLWPALRRQLHEARRPAALVDERRNTVTNHLGGWFAALSSQPVWVLAAVVLVTTLPGIWIAATHPFARPRPLPVAPLTTDLADHPTSPQPHASPNRDLDPTRSGKRLPTFTDRLGDDELVARADYPATSSTSFEAEDPDSPPTTDPSPNPASSSGGFGIVDRAVSGLAQ